VLVVHWVRSGRVCRPAGRTYAALRRGELTWPDPSQLACRDDLMDTLWGDSAEFVGLGHEATDPSRSPPTTIERAHSRKPQRRCDESGQAPIARADAAATLLDSVADPTLARTAINVAGE
jgi:hypothetical protein